MENDYFKRDYNLIIRCQTLLSTGIFNFDFDSENNGSLVVSSQWWLDLIVTVPLTVGTFTTFHIMRRRQKQNDAASDRKPTDDA